MLNMLVKVRNLNGKQSKNNFTNFSAQLFMYRQHPYYNSLFFSSTYPFRI